MQEEKIIWEAKPSQRTNIVFYIFLFWTVILPLIRFLQTWCTNYKLTSQRLYIKTGVFSQTIEQTELYRIRDYTVKKPLKQRIFGLGTLEIISSDKTQPNIHLTAIKDPEGIADLLREGVELSRRATQTREVDFT